MGSLVRNVSALSAIGYGVNIFEQQPPGSVQGIRTNRVGMVAFLPWGPVDAITRVTSFGEFFDTFYPNALATTKDYTTYPAILALLNKTFPAGIDIVRISPAAAAKSTSGALTAGTGTVTIIAKYAGLIGDQIKYQFVAATDGDAAKRDLVITTTAGYSARYKNLTYTTVDDVDDPLVDVTSSSPSAMPAVDVSAVALASGADGTPAAADYGTAAGSSGVGVDLFWSENAEAKIVFVAEPDSALIDGINAILEGYAVTHDKGIAILCTPDGQAASAAETYVADYRSDRLIYPWPKVLTANGYDTDLAEIEVQGASFVAAALANTDPWESPGGANGRQWLQGISGLEDESASTATYDSLNEEGIAPFAIVTGLGAIIRNAITTSLTSGEERISRRRYADYLANSIADRAAYYVEKPLDVDLTARTLGPNSAGLAGEIRQFLQDEKDRNHLKAYSVDAFSGNVASDISAGRWYIQIAVTFYAPMAEIVLLANMGEGVVVVEEA